MPAYPTLNTITGRTFTTFPVALQAIVVDDQDRLLFLSSPRRNGPGVWQTVSGALEADETILEGTLREIGEELGPDVHVRPVGVAHAQTFRYDENVPFMVATYYVFAYDGGVVAPGDDMAGSAWRWFSLDELADIYVQIPPDGDWLMERAVELTRRWRQGWAGHPLQPPL